MSDPEEQCKARVLIVPTRESKPLFLEAFVKALEDVLTGAPVTHSVLAQVQREEFDGTNPDTCGRVILRVIRVPVETVPKVHDVIEAERRRFRAEVARKAARKAAKSSPGTAPGAAPEAPETPSPNPTK